MHRFKKKRFTLAEGRVGPAEASARTGADSAAHKARCFSQNSRLRMLEEKARHASLSLENGNLQRRLEASEERLARPTSLPAFSSAPAAHTQATPSTSDSASSSTTQIVHARFVAQETSTETVQVNIVSDVTTAL